LPSTSAQDLPSPEVWEDSFLTWNNHYPSSLKGKSLICKLWNLNPRFVTWKMWNKIISIKAREAMKAKVFISEIIKACCKRSK
jgi:hypothetical protein